MQSAAPPPAPLTSAIPKASVVASEDKEDEVESNDDEGGELFASLGLTNSPERGSSGEEEGME